MICEFAVEPAAIGNWKDFRYIMDQVGVEHGRLVSRFPAKWPRMVIETFAASESLRDVERIRIVEKLTNMGHKLIKSNRAYDPGKS